MFIEPIGTGGGDRGFDSRPREKRTYRTIGGKLVKVPHLTRMKPGDRFYGLSATKWDKKAGTYYGIFGAHRDMITIQPQTN